MQLGQSPFLALLSERKVNETLKLMGRPAGDRLTREVTLEVCQRTGSTAMLTGSIAGLGSQYVIGLKAVNCNSGDVMAEAQEQAAGKEAVLKALDAAAVSLRGKLGESLSSVQKYAIPVEEATTPSLEALKAYTLGLKTAKERGATLGLPFFMRAVGLDPDFAMAYCHLSVLYDDLDESWRGAENARKAYALRGKVSEPERFDIDGRYYMIATGELEKAAQTYEQWQRAYPRDSQSYRSLGNISDAWGNWEKALQEHGEALRLEPGNPSNYGNLGHDYMSLNRLDEAEAVYKQAQQRRVGDQRLLSTRYQLAFLRGDTAQMAHLVSVATGEQGIEDQLLFAQAGTEGWYGRFKNAHELTRRAMDSVQRNDAKETAAGYQVTAALSEVETGNRKRARVQAKAALKLASNRYVRTKAALTLARAGDTAGAETLEVELEKTFSLDTLLQRYWLPIIRAAVALERQDPNRAIELLNIAGKVELGGVSRLESAYLRGEAYRVLHDGSRAASEFQKFADHRGLVGNFPWGALARLGLARAYALEAGIGGTAVPIVRNQETATGRMPVPQSYALAKARTAYKGFLTLWKDADPDIPILKEAKAEYAKLQ